MQTFLNDFLAQVKGIWGRLDAGQRLVVLAVSAATVVGFGAIVWFAGRPSYEVVATASTAEEINQIRQALLQAGISYEPDGNGRSFLVERSQTAAAKMALAAAGVDGARTPNFGTSIIDDAETKAFKLNAASVAMAENAIRELDGVLAARVTASAPKRQAAFRDRDRLTRPSATVTLRLRTGASFESIAHAAAALTASQLMIPKENIDVFSGTQKYRYDPDRDVGGGGSEFLALQRQMGLDRTARAQEQLERLWPGKASVLVTVDLDSSWEIRSEKVLPTEQIVKSEKSVKDSTQTKPTEAKDGVSTAAPGAENSKRNETHDREYVTEIGERRTGKMAPDVKRLTVAVLYDRSLEEAQGFDKEALANAVKAIVGWDPQRDPADGFSMLAGDFVPIEEGEPTTSSPGFADLAVRWGPTIGQILGVVVVVLFLRGLFKRSGARTASAGGGGAVGGALGASASEVREEDLPPEDQQKRMRREIERSIASDPAALAKLLEAWLLEQKA